MRSLLMLLLCLGITTAQAQKMSWRKHAKLAKKQFEAKNYEDAATNFEAAWKKKSKKKEYIFQAAECYYMLKDYRKAAEAYEHVKEDNDKFMFPGLKYCRSLKMDGQYDEASRAFVYFINGYSGDDKEIVALIVQDEIRGCEKGMAMLEQDASNITFEHLSDNVNSKGADFAPVPFSDDVLYYSSNMVGETKMYLSQRNGGVWSRSRVPKNFPKIAAKHFGNGAFSPDNKRFYYTQCEKIDATGRMIYGCEIYVTSRNDDGWSAPQKLNNKINKAGSTATHPFIIHEGDKEIMYFTSNRSGGEGGLDIWRSMRDKNSEKLDFQKPTNLGATINSMSDEITPYFSMEENILYFSSNGKVNIGGFDIFQSMKQGESSWGKPMNIGLPFNSSADDYYFRKYATEGGYVVSNRKFGLEKTTFFDDDIFSFSVPTEKMMASGKIMDKNTNQPLQDVSVSIYEITTEGKIRLLENKSFSGGDYEFGLLPEKNYRIEAAREGFSVEGIEISTMNNEQTSFVNNLMLADANAITTNESGMGMGMETTPNSRSTIGQPDGTFSNPQPSATVIMEDEGFSSDSGEIEIVDVSPTSTVPTPGRTTNSSTTNSTEFSNNTTTNTYPSSSVVGEAGVVYKIQLIAVRKFDSSHPRYIKPQNYGNLETEYLPNRNLTRVMLSNFSTKEEADQILRSMKQERAFKTAVVVRYENGVRIDPWKK